MLPEAGSTAVAGAAAGACTVGEGDLGAGVVALTVGWRAGVGAGFGADLGGEGRGLKVLGRGAPLVALGVPAGRAGGDGMVT